MEWYVAQSVTNIEKLCEILQYTDGGVSSGLAPKLAWSEVNKQFLANIKIRLRHVCSVCDSVLH